MTIKVYSRYAEDGRGTRDGDLLTNVYRGLQVNKEEK
jgi:hypothetical protein